MYGAERKAADQKRQVEDKQISDKTFNRVSNRTSNRTSHSLSHGASFRSFRKVAALALTACMVFSLAACGSKSSKNTADDNTLVVGFDQNFPPFGYKDDDGNFTGFDLEMAKAAAQKMGMKVKYQPVDWDAKDMELDAGTVDCLWNGFTINGREKQYTWTDPYMDNSQVVVVKKDSGITDLKGLAGKTVEVQKESSAESALNDDDHKELKSSFKDMLTTADYNTAMMDLEQGSVDAIAMDIFVAKDQIKGKEDTFKILDDQISSEQYAVGFKKGNTKLRDKVEDAMKELVKDGTFKKLSEKYFDADVCILKAD